MTSVDGRPEILRLARLLRKEPTELDFLLDVPDADLRVFREQVTESLFSAHTGVLRRLSAAAKLLPNPVIAKVGEKVFGPLLCARVAGELDPAKATDVADRLPVTFLADVAVELDPRRAQAIIERLPNDTVVRTARILADRQDWITLGRFVGFLPRERTAACLAAFDDVELVHTAFAIDDPAAVPTAIDLLSEQRLASLARAANDAGLQPLLLAVAELLSEDQRAKLAELLDDPVA